MEICDYCDTGELKLVPADLPWSAEHFICPVCDSTYNVEHSIELELDMEVVL